MARIKKPRRMRCKHCSYMFEITDSNICIINGEEITFCINCGSEMDSKGRLVGY